MWVTSKLRNIIQSWLLYEKPLGSCPLTDFERLAYELRPADVLLVEGRSRVSDVIRVITQSPWTHSMLYIGRLHDIENPILRARVKDFYNGSPDEQLVIEGMLGQGTIVTSLEVYRDEHLRICRPKGIARKDAQKVVGHAIGKLGGGYDVRQLFDLARFLIPISILPRKWRSSLFNHSKTMRAVCSTMMAEAFQSVKFPILPVIAPHETNGVEFFVRNPRLVTPKDFDYSPYFEIIKYPFINITEHALYPHLNWQDSPRDQEINISFDMAQVGSEMFKTINGREEDLKPNEPEAEEDLPNNPDETDQKS